MRLKELCQGAGIACPAEYESETVTGICTDSRHAANGNLFVCIRGLRNDGHDYIADAVAHGAAFVLADRYAKPKKIENAIWLQCADTRVAVAHLWRAWYGFPDRRLKLIGVTGTNGKTSVTHMIRAILEATLHRCGLIGTIGCESVGRRLDVVSHDILANMTTPDPEELYKILSEMVRDEVEYVVMEISSHALSLEKLSPLRFEVAVFTNLTPEHLDFHHTMENYAAAKAKLFERARIGIINADSPYAVQMAASVAGRCITCTTKNADADYAAESIANHGGEGVSYRLRSLRTRLSISCPLLGAFTVINSMQAAICALELGCSPATIKTVLGTLSPIRGRMEKVHLGHSADFTVIVDYAHTPDAIEKALRTARELVGKGGKLTLLFGCGGDRDTTKRAVMGRIASRLCDEVILTSDNSRSEDPNAIIAEIRSGMTEKEPIATIVDRETAIRFAIGRAATGDLILLCGKGHEEYEITRTGKRPFFEKEIVVDAFRTRYHY